MSRHIQGTPHLDQEDELYQKTLRSNKVLILRNNGCLYAFLIRENRIYKVVKEEQSRFPIGIVLIGKVANVAKQIDGVFIKMESIKGRESAVGYLSLKENDACRPLNRKPDGRILSGDEIAVQVTKEAQKSKNFQLTTKISLAGQFVVVKKGTGKVHYSHKYSRAERDRLQEAFEEWKAEMDQNGFFRDIDITFRTNASAVKGDIWKEELIDYVSQMNEIDQMSQTRTTYSILWKPETAYLDLLKNLPLASLDEIVTDEKDVYEELIKHPYANGTPIRLYEDNRISLQKVYSLNTRLQELLSRRVYMKSGATLMIEQTEALISIDVNSGGAEKKTDPEAFYFKINMEAVKEVCYQLSARNLCGMILIDFINMKDQDHVEELLYALKEEVKKDPVLTSFVDYTKLGLAELTRKKTSAPLRDIMRDWEFDFREQ